MSDKARGSDALERRSSKRQKKRSEGRQQLAPHLYVLSKAAHSGPSACVSEREPSAHSLYLVSVRTVWCATAVADYRVLLGDRQSKNQIFLANRILLAEKSQETQPASF